MQEVLKRDNVPDSGNEIRSKYKQIHQKWLNMKENSSYKASDNGIDSLMKATTAVEDQQFHLQ